MTNEAVDEAEGPTDLEREIAARANRRDSSGRSHSAVELGIGVGGTLLLFGLIGWGVLSLFGWIGGGISQIIREGEEIQVKLAASEARQERGGAGEVSNAVVQAGAMTTIQNRAVDPGSVRFRDVAVIRQPSGMKAVCGEFNAKNRLGGYNGFERFISAGTGQHTYIESEVDDFQSAWVSVCQR